MRKIITRSRGDREVQTAAGVGALQQTDGDSQRLIILYKQT